MNPAFLMSLPPPSTPPNPKSPPKRYRPSTLARKYRRVQERDDNALVGHPSLPSPLPSVSPVRFSRFPSTWQEAIDQALTAVCTAVGEGNDRIRVDLINPEQIQSASILPGLNPASRRIALLVEAACATIENILTLDPSRSCNYALPFVPERAVIYFDSAADAEVGKTLIPEALRDRVKLYVLGEVQRPSHINDVIFVIAPTNRNGNPWHLEHVEAVHYANWAHRKIVIMINPDLIALTRFTTVDDEPRQPCFMSDYLDCYYLDPVVYPTRKLTGAILKCFPRKWEMYLMRMTGGGFKLVAEQHKPFTAEKIRCEFGWRVDPDIEKAVML